MKHSKSGWKNISRDKLYHGNSSRQRAQRAIEDRSSTYRAFIYRTRHGGLASDWYGRYDYRAQFGFDVVWAP